MFKKPNWQETTGALFTKKRGRVESGATANKSKPEVRTGFERFGNVTFHIKELLSPFSRFLLRFGQKGPFRGKDR